MQMLRLDRVLEGEPLRIAAVSVTIELVFVFLLKIARASVIQLFISLHRLSMSRVLT